MYLTNAREAAVCGVKGGRQTFNSEYDIGLYRHPICHDKGRFHPTQKPLALIKELVEKHSNPGDTVMDCFSGSGTTCLAAIQLGRKFIGCELSEEYWKKSVDRINSEANMPNGKDAIAANPTLDLFC
jgi:DNA modification methylase